MATEYRFKAVDAPADNPEDTMDSLGSDPYICSLIGKADRPFKEERRRKPRDKTPLGRRALLLVQGRRSTS